MVDMKDKFSVIGRDKDGNTVSITNIVGCTFNELEKRANEISEKNGLTYEILRDKTIFEVIYYFQNKEQSKWEADKEDWQQLYDKVDNLEWEATKIRHAIEEYLEKHNEG